MDNKAAILDVLEAVVAERAQASADESYVAKLLQGHEDKLLKKIGEEATEVVLAAKGGTHDEIVYESADLLFHLLVVLARHGIAVEEIFVELGRRFGLSGLTEKAQRSE
ncbi:phosphoribosyl-ATP diphosphatase [Suttonella sp. R2A3]|uniref:phosphoribosyl-ATP diphosphatase n=1 Tax=Suttonella sp. R2A3 TaxID=2908648 RepID=UPI001F188CE8|nr:phosphoribosyl-ATP diphosphatase [Suttonella sp. R2A3]UJF23994.1 phosphoribosyl-ATP diphosphatase [Suttonella sp. R2A3]